MWPACLASLLQTRQRLTHSSASRWFFRSTNRLSDAKLQEIKESKLRNVSKKIMQNCEEIKTICVVYGGLRFFRIWGLPFFSKSTSPWPTFISGHPRSVLPGKALPTPSNIGELLNEHRERIIGIIGQCHVSRVDIWKRLKTLRRSAQIGGSQLGSAKQERVTHGVYMGPQIQLHIAAHSSIFSHILPQDAETWVLEAPCKVRTFSLRAYTGPTLGHCSAVDSAPCKRSLKGFPQRRAAGKFKCILRQETWQSTEHAVTMQPHAACSIHLSMTLPNFALALPSD